MLKFIIIADTHIVPKSEKCNGLDSFERLNLAIKSINNDHPDVDFCIHAGDITDKGDVESYKRFKELKSKLDKYCSDRSIVKSKLIKSLIEEYLNQKDI